ncbi:nuclear transport factor 2 family protein [Streptomyces avicenniae]|uniref:nuclear transport factor 2 family protein n=1 Tax=Streptomyces avicenniae TaxID=500153 RepID=UPI003B8349C9
MARSCGDGVVRAAGAEFLGTGATAVVLTRVRARARATGREPVLPVLGALTVRDGRIVEVRPFSWDSVAIADACGA